MNARTVTALTPPRVATHCGTGTHSGVLERTFSVIVLFLYTGGVLPLLRLESGVDFDELEGDPVTRFTWLAVYAVTFILLTRRVRTTLQLFVRERWLILLCGVAVASVLWSVAPAVTFRRSIALLGTTAFGLYLASRYTVAELLRLVDWVLGVSVVLSVATVAVAPTYGISSDGTEWRGIFLHKNILGGQMALAILVSLFQIRRRGLANCLVTIVVLALASLALFNSHSVAGMLAVVIVAVTLPLWPVLRLQRPLAVASVVFALMTLGAAAWLVSTQANAIASAVGRDASMTGRTPLWAAVIDSITNRLWLGHGYAAFWLGWEGESGRIWSSLSWRPVHAHNGFLDLGLELGMVGFALFAVGFTVAVCRATPLIWRTKTAFGLWPIAYLLFIVTINLAESTIMVRNGVFWMLYVVTCIWLIRHGSERRSA